MPSTASGKFALALVAASLCSLVSPPARAVPENKEAAEAYARYLAASEARMKAEIQSGPFLWVDGLPENARKDAYSRIRNGSVEVKRMNPRREGQPPESAQALIHDWVGLVFIPNVTLARSIAVMQDFAHYDSYYYPDMRHTRLLSHNGNDFKIALQLYRKSIVTVVFDTEFEINYQYPATGRAVSHDRATRLVEVQNAGQRGERELTPAESHGFFWGLNDYWRFEEKDGGVYVQLESIGITRSVPTLFAWLVNPLINSIPRGVLINLLSTTRSAVEHPLVASTVRAKTAE
jgi:hypothetical protein